MSELSLAEQHLLSFARKEFGEFLTRFLLTGLDQEEAVQSRLFTITWINAEGITAKCFVRTIADKPLGALSSLPWHRDPLVLLALLYQMNRGKLIASNMVKYTVDDMLKLLGWEETAESLCLVDEAVERYFKLTYRVSIDADELKHQQLVSFNHIECLISRFSTSDEVDGNQRIQRTANKVHFSSGLIEQLKNRTFLGVEWNNVLAMTVDTKFVN